MILAVFVAVVAHRAVILLPHRRNERTPFGFPVLCHSHFTAGQEQPAAFGLRQCGVVDLECRVAGKPAAPFGLAGHIMVKKADACPPYPVGTVDGRLQCHLQAQLLCKPDGIAKLLVCWGGIGLPVDLLAVRRGLHPAGRQDDPIRSGGFCHIRHTAAGSFPCKRSPVGKGRKIDTVKLFIPVHRKTSLYPEIKRQIAQSV